MMDLSSNPRLQPIESVKTMSIYVKWKYLKYYVENKALFETRK